MLVLVVLLPLLMVLCLLMVVVVVVVMVILRVALVVVLVILRYGSINNKALDQTHSEDNGDKLRANGDRHNCFSKSMT